MICIYTLLTLAAVNFLKSLYKFFERQQNCLVYGDSRYISGTEMSVANCTKVRFRYYKVYPIG